MKNIKHTKRNKGFEKDNFLYTSDFNLSSELILGEIEKIYEDINSKNLSIKEKQIIQIIKKSYEKESAGVSFDESDFVLSQHELLEFKNLEKKNYLRYLVYRYKYNKFPSLKYLDDYPPCIQIEPTSICNLRCIMCYQSDKSFSVKSGGFMGNMNIEIFKKVVDEIQGKIESVTLASRGEPTLYQNLDEMLKYCEGKFLALKINTNATMFNEKLIHSLLSSDIQTIVFSIDEKNKENYEKIRVNAKFEKIMANLELFAEIKKKHYQNSKTVIRISGVKINTSQNVEDMQDHYKKFADQITLVNYNPWESAYTNEPNDITDICGELYRRMFVWWDGKVNPCDYDYKSVLSKWNVKESSIKEIWNSDYYNYIRERHKLKERSKIEPCSRCISV